MSTWSNLISQVEYGANTPVVQTVDAHSMYAPFAEPVLKLARLFRAEEIEELLQQCLTETRD